MGDFSLNSDVLRDINDGNLPNFSFGFSFASTVNPDETVTRTIDLSKLKRPAPYLQNYHIPPTDTKPTIAGIHFSEKGALEFTLRYPDNKYYILSPSYRTKGVIPINKKGILAARCFKGPLRNCKGKAKLKYKKDLCHLSDVETYRDEVLNADNWIIIEHPDTTHICGCPVKAYHSDRMNFSYEYKQSRLKLLDPDGRTSWDYCFAKWESGLGLDIDGVILDIHEY